MIKRDGDGKPESGTPEKAGPATAEAHAVVPAAVSDAAEGPEDLSALPPILEKPRTRPPRRPEEVTERRREKFETIAAMRDLRAAVVLEDITDPHNAAAAFRSADAFGIQEIHLVFERQRPFDPLRKEFRKTSGRSNKWLDFRRHEGSTAAMAALKVAGYTLIATKVDPSARPLPSIDFSSIERPAFIFGNEHSGISPAVEEAADILTFIPMVGLAESFNLSVSVALTLYEYFGQMRLGRAPAPGAPRKLATEAEAEALFRRWLGRM